MAEAKYIREKHWPNTPLGDWLALNDAYYYYLSYLEKRLDGCDVLYDGAYATVVWSGYTIARLFVSYGSIYLVMPKEIVDAPNGVVQRKLMHEYWEAFDLGYGDYKLTQQNVIVLDRYAEKAKKKITAGFAKYTKLMKERKLEENNSAYLKISIDNAFSVSELNRLISAYNELYSLMYCVCEYGYEEVEKMDMKNVINSHSMVLESISIGSSGFLVSVLSQVVATGIIALGKALLEDDKAGYEQKKQELLDIANNEKPDDGARILTLAQRLDNWKRLQESGRVPNDVIEREVKRIMEEIADLQGTPRLDLYV